jgi:predicted acyl esterase
MDQKKNEEKRLDAVVFSSPRLEEDMVLTGKVRAVVFVSTKGKDADVFVSLNDVYVDEETGEEVSMQVSVLNCWCLSLSLYTTAIIHMF